MDRVLITFLIMATVMFFVGNQFTGMCGAQEPYRTGRQFSRLAPSHSQQMRDPAHVPVDAQLIYDEHHNKQVDSKIIIHKPQTIALLDPKQSQIETFENAYQEKINALRTMLTKLNPHSPEAAQVRMELNTLSQQQLQNISEDIKDKSNNLIPNGVQGSSAQLHESDIPRTNMN
jgi:hypothetical protein